MYSRQYLLPRSPQHESRNSKVDPVLYTIAIILVILWLLGMVSSFTMGGFVHVLIVVAVIVVLVKLITGRRVV